MSLQIRPARPGDVAAITAMVHELAAFEDAAAQCTVTETALHTALFGPAPVAHAHVALVDGAVAGTAVWFLNFSTWDGVAGVHLEDLFVRAAFRRRGVARALLATLARHCVQHGYTRLSWAVLNWNTDAIALYDTVGADPQRQWTTYRLSGPALAGLAASPDPPD
ncbi:GNAT family N-acetyltransferase [Mycobacterium koreense]|uniref:GNAT family N-acetyltransferase n=1 Tax=Mycolicibacillus koreensis TaxID=1069220 RepID=A0A7I7SE84_9MYCO|nr:GNAT family N-acetyltransferase [Mycolicibacillus koreensis]MCV7249924.1 GNAT family N-acetyltransferase [Mycolicibacillus koreensis]OSC34858.1 GNAT family N-acetyltransferase [Mycolicibacillus koreensis]BBY54721.1 N-acetyltransferase GCN5 [Mycolicibacillus koreensis]